MTALLASSAGNVLVWMVWFAAAAACVGSGVAVISFSNPFYSALALIGNLASLAVLYLLLSAEFVAAAQVLVYAGAVMVLFLFVIAYLGGRADAPWMGGPYVSVQLTCLDDADLTDVPINYFDGRHDNWQAPRAERSPARMV